MKIKDYVLAIQKQAEAIDYSDLDKDVIYQQQDGTWATINSVEIRANEDNITVEFK